jgi:hypothetical protein
MVAPSPGSGTEEGFVLFIAHRWIFVFAVIGASSLMYDADTALCGFALQTKPALSTEATGQPSNHAYYSALA